MTKLYTLAAACGATNAYENSPKIGFDPEAWAKFEEALTPSGLPQPQTVAPSQLSESMSRDEVLKYYSDYANVQAHEALRYQKRIRELEAALSAPAVETVAEQPGLIALAEKCSAEVGRYEGKVVWVKFHSQAAVEAFATGVVMSAAVRSHAKPVAPKAQQAAPQGCALCWNKARIPPVCDACHDDMGTRATPAQAEGEALDLLLRVSDWLKFEKRPFPSDLEADIAMTLGERHDA